MNATKFWKPRLKVYKGKNWEFNPATMYADSYGWWPMLMVIKGKTVRNVYDYSQETAKHQSKLDTILDHEGIVPDLVVSVRASLDDLDRVEDELLRNWATEEIKLKYSRKKVGRKRVNYLDETLRVVEAAKIGIKFTKADKLQALEQAEANRREKLEKRRRNNSPKPEPIAQGGIPNAPRQHSRPQLTLVMGDLV